MAEEGYVFVADPLKEDRDRLRAKLVEVLDILDAGHPGLAAKVIRRELNS